MILQPALESYHVADSPIHRLDARLKLLATLAFVLAVTSLPPSAWAALLLLGVVALALTVSSRVPLVTALKRSLIALPFAGMIALSIPFTRGGLVLWRVQLGSWTLAVTDLGLVTWTSIVVKAWLSVWVSGLLVATTPFPALLKAMQALRLPQILVTIIALMVRYLFVLVDEATRLQTARQARSAGTAATARAGGTLFWRVKVLGGMIGSLFIRSYERSERIYHAMLSRGYDGQWPALNPLIWQPQDTWAGILLGTCLTAIAILGQVMG
ncbi:MAG: cobalt ECF transporter T component CbiQ [Anaerolineae bacterium]|nr:cobalt ECF transporter T component CbiQ [Anaerolineae bacterium]